MFEHRHHYRDQKRAFERAIADDVAAERRQREDREEWRRHHAAENLACRPLMKRK